MEFGSLVSTRTSSQPQGACVQVNKAYHLSCPIHNLPSENIASPRFRSFSRVEVCGAIASGTRVVCDDGNSEHRVNWTQKYLSPPGTKSPLSEIDFADSPYDALKPTRLPTNLSQTFTQIATQPGNIPSPGLSHQDYVRYMDKSCDKQAEVSDRGDNSDQNEQVSSSPYERYIETPTQDFGSALNAIFDLGEDIKALQTQLDRNNAKLILLESRHEQLEYTLHSIQTMERDISPLAI